MKPTLHLEQEFINIDLNKRYQLRLEQIKPVIDAFEWWCKEKKNQVLPKSALGEAISFTLKQWEKLSAFLLDSRLEISNNRGERAIKPFVIKRKNLFFSNTPNGATASAIIYSI